MVELKQYWRENPVEGALFVLVLVGAVNWGIIGLGMTSVVERVVSNPNTIDTVYVAVGAAGAVLLANDLGVVPVFRGEDE